MTVLGVCLRKNLGRRYQKIAFIYALAKDTFSTMVVLYLDI